jgi:hypothetical protein
MIRGQKKIEARIDEIAQFFSVEHATGVMNEIARRERAVPKPLIVILPNQPRDLLPQFYMRRHGVLR